jgi:membrane associated rhomboid family serine protease
VPTCYRHPDRESYIRCQRCERTICPDCMRDAAVGFQCPSCVAEGAKQTRQGRAAYGGKRSANPALTSVVLIGLNLAVWLAIWATGGRTSRLVDLLAIMPLGRCQADRGGYYPQVGAEATCQLIPGGTTWVPGVADGAVWQLLTNAFSHVEIWHIAFNMLALWVLGPQLEAALGRVRFLALYLVSALAGSTAVMWLSDEQVQTLGASGAVFGLLGAFLVIARKVGGNLQPILMILGINLVITVAGSSFISWQGHLGGLVGGLLTTAALVYAPRERRGLWQLLAVAALVVGLLAACVVRVLALR